MYIVIRYLVQLSPVHKYLEITVKLYLNRNCMVLDRIWHSQILANKILNFG
jgi:hypothetical protein